VKGVPIAVDCLIAANGFSLSVGENIERNTHEELRSGLEALRAENEVIAWTREQRYGHIIAIEECKPSWISSTRHVMSLAISEKAIV